jgi:hypothetical protein
MRKLIRRPEMPVYSEIVFYAPHTLAADAFSIRSETLWVPKLASCLQIGDFSDCATIFGTLHGLIHEYESA